MNTKRVGDETEARIIATLIGKGYTVSIPFGDNDGYDLVLDTGAELQRVQCKTGWIEDDVIRFKTVSKTTVDGTWQQRAMTTTTSMHSQCDAETPSSYTGSQSEKQGPEVRTYGSQNRRSTIRVLT